MECAKEHYSQVDPGIGVHKSTMPQIWIRLQIASHGSCVIDGRLEIERPMAALCSKVATCFMES